MLNALVISGGSFQGTTLIKCLSESNSITIHLADYLSENINRYDVDKFHEVPPIANEDAFINKLLDIIKTEHIKIAFPSTEHELPILSRNLDVFREYGVAVAVSSYTLMDTLSNKIKAHDFLIKHSFPTLKSIEISDDALDFPIIGKPAVGSGSKDIRLLSGQEELENALHSENLSNYLWQPYLESCNEFSIDFSIDFHGRLSPLIMRERIQTIGGFAVITELAQDGHIHDEVKRFAKLLSDHGGCGLFNVQILKEPNNDFHFSDINPRVGTSSIFCLGLSINLPLLLCASISKVRIRDQSSPAHPQSVRMIRNLSQKWIRTAPTKNIEGLVFDLDDTITNHKSWIIDKLQIIYTQHKDKLPPRKDFMLCAYLLLEEGKKEKLIDELDKAFSFPLGMRDELIASFRAAIPKRVGVFRDVLYNLIRLKEARIKLAILTDNPVESQRQKLKQIDFTHLFDAIIYSTELGTSKPDPIVFNETAKQLHIPKINLGMVGDNLCRDCYGALDAGFGVSYYIRRKKTCYDFDADCFFELTGYPKDKIIEIDSFSDIVLKGG